MESVVTNPSVSNPAGIRVLIPRAFLLADSHSSAALNADNTNEHVRRKLGHNKRDAKEILSDVFDKALRSGDLFGKYQGSLR